MEYYKEEYLIKTQAQKQKTLKIYFITLAVYFVISIALFVAFKFQIYQSPNIKTIKFVHYTISVIFTFYTFVYLGIKYRRVKCYFKALHNIKVGIRETYEAEFLGYKNTSETNNGVEYKALLFKEWNKYKKDYYKRKVLVFNELPFPELIEGKMVRFVTQSNTLVEYEYIEEKNQNE